MNEPRKPIPIALLTAVLAASPAAAWAAAPAQGAAPAQTKPAEGLNALDDSRVLSEIAGRDLTDLLEHAFAARGVAPDRRAALLARISLNRLESDQPLPTAERRGLVSDVAAQTAASLGQADDPGLLLDQAQLLMSKGVNEEARLLEYFGDNPELRAYLKPVTAEIGQMLDRAAVLSRAEADGWADKIQQPGDAATRQWQTADAAARKAKDFGVLADYNRVLALDPDDPQRLSVADTLLETVKAADTAQNPRRSFVRLYLGKIALARGNEAGLAKARTYLDQVIADDQDPAELFDAHYFRTAVEVQDRKLDAAAALLDEFKAWFAGQTLPDREPLMSVLEYRLADAMAKYGATEAAKREASARATAILIDLVDRYEGYRPVVTAQLLARVGPETDLSTLSPLLLDALVDRGRAEAARLAAQGPSAKPATPPVNREAIERGVAAAKSLLARAAKGGPDAPEPATVARDAFLLGLMQDLLGDKIGAAETFLGYRDVPGAEQQQTVSALRRALGIVEELKKTVGDDEARRVRVDELEGRLLPLLVDAPVNDKGRAFDLANRLHRLGQLDGAIKYYREVPDSDPRRADAGYLLLLATTSRTAELGADAPQRRALMAELPDLGRRTMTALQKAVSSASGDEARDAYRERLARTKVMMARLALNEAGAPQEALDLLGGIEADVKGLPPATGESILSAALPLRFQATAATGQIDRATADLLALLDRSDAQRGLSYISQFRDALNGAMDRARARDDAEAMRRTMETRAAVTPKLVDWIEKSDDPAYKRYVYNFRRFNAETQYQAATLADDPAARRQRLGEALSAYEGLESPEGLRQYRSLLEGMSDAQRANVPYDREVVFALGNIHYALAAVDADAGNAVAAKSEYEAARSRYARLLADRAMGNATRLVEADGVTRSVPNDDYWELYLKFIRSNLALGNAPKKMADELRKLRVIGGDATGGTRWADEYARLAAELGVR